MDPVQEKIIGKIKEIYDILDPSGDNSQRIVSLLQSMDADTFHQYMVDLKEKKTQLYIYAPNMMNNLKLENIFKAARKLGLELFEQVWFTDEVTGQRYLTTEKYLVLKLPVRRTRQIIDKKLAVPDSDKKIDIYSGQVVKPDKAASLSQIEAQILMYKGLRKTTLELMKYRGGDIYGYSEIRQQLIETGSCIMQDTSTTLPRSVVVADMYFKSMHINVPLNPSISYYNPEGKQPGK